MATLFTLLPMLLGGGGQQPMGSTHTATNHHIVNVAGPTVHVGSVSHGQTSSSTTIVSTTPKPNLFDLPPEVLRYLQSHPHYSEKFAHRAKRKSPFAFSLFTMFNNLPFRFPYSISVIAWSGCRLLSITLPPTDPRLWLRIFKFYQQKQAFFTQLSSKTVSRTHSHGFLQTSFVETVF